MQPTPAPTGVRSLGWIRLQLALPPMTRSTPSRSRVAAYRNPGPSVWRSSVLPALLYGVGTRVRTRLIDEFKELMRTLLKAGSAAILIGGALLAQQAGTIVLPTASHGVSDSLFNLALQHSFSRLSAATVPFEATEMVQNHGPLVE